MRNAGGTPALSKRAAAKAKKLAKKQAKSKKSRTHPFGEVGESGEDDSEDGGMGAATSAEAAAARAARFSGPEGDSALSRAMMGMGMEPSKRGKKGRAAALAPLGSGGLLGKAGKGAGGTPLHWNPHAASVLREAGAASHSLDGVDLDRVGVVVGRSRSLDQRYLRLTGPPDPANVRPPAVLGRALAHVCRAWLGGEESYVWVCDRLKAVRQDLVVQRVTSPLTVRAYEAHARIAAEVGDAGEFNQCQMQLAELFEHPALLAGGAAPAQPPWLRRSAVEFCAYRLLFLLFSGDASEAERVLAALSPADLAEPAIAHALRVRRAVAQHDFAAFFTGLAAAAPGRSLDLMRLLCHSMRIRGLAALCRAFKPALPLGRVCYLLGFTLLWKRHRRGAGIALEAVEQGHAEAEAPPALGGAANGEAATASGEAAAAATGQLAAWGVDDACLRECRRFVEHCGAVLRVAGASEAVPRLPVLPDEEDESKLAELEAAGPWCVATGDASLEIDTRATAIDESTKPIDALRANPVF